MKQTFVIIALAGLVAGCHAQDKSQEFPAFPTNATQRTFSDPKYFSSVKRTNGNIVVKMPLTAELFRAFLNERDLGPVTEDIAVTLGKHDVLRLQWKRATILARQETSVALSTVQIVRIFTDLKGNTTTNFIVLTEEQKKRIANQALHGTR